MQYLDDIAVFSGQCQDEVSTFDAQISITDYGEGSVGLHFVENQIRSRVITELQVCPGSQFASKIDRSEPAMQAPGPGSIATMTVTDVQLLTVRNLYQLGQCNLGLPPIGPFVLSQATGAVSDQEMAKALAMSMIGNCSAQQAYLRDTGVLAALQSLGSIQMGPSGTADELMQNAERDLQTYFEEHN